MPDQHLVLFDGDCAYCNGWVNWIRERDRSSRIRFAPLESPEGRDLRIRHGLPEHLDTVVLVMDGQAFTRSDAAWRILQQLPGHGFWGGLLRLAPRPLRNWGYDLVARNRHRLGLKDNCELPARK